MSAAADSSSSAASSVQFDAGSPCLQFLDAAVAEPAPLHAWAVAVLGVRDLADPTPKQMADAMMLQGAIGRMAAAVAGGAMAPIGDIARMNRIAATPALAPQMGVGRSTDWAWPTTIGQVLSTVARDMVTLLTTANRERVRQCDAPDCDRLFVDTSRPGRRRWCSMETCGNRAKLRSFRKRHRQATPQGHGPASPE